MVIKRAGEKRRGIRPGIEKQRMKGKSEPREDLYNRKLLGIPTHRLSRIAETCFAFLCLSCCNLAIIPLKYKNGQLVDTCNWKRCIIHYAGLAITVVILVTRALLVASYVHQHGLTAETLMMTVMLAPYLCSATLGAGTVFMCTETLQLVNSRKYTLRCLQRASGRYLSGFEDVGLSLKVIGAGCGAIFGPVILSVLPFVYPNLPLGVRNVILGFRFSNSVHPLIFHIVCTAVDFFLILVPTLSAAFGAAVLIVGIDVLKLYYELIRYVTKLLLS